MQGGNLLEKKSKSNNNSWHNNTLPSFLYIVIQKEYLTTCGPSCNESLLKLLPTNYLMDHMASYIDKVEGLGEDLSMPLLFKISVFLKAWYGENVVE